MQPTGHKRRHLILIVLLIVTSLLGGTGLSVVQAMPQDPAQPTATQLGLAAESDGDPQTVTLTVEQVAELLEDCDLDATPTAIELVLTPELWAMVEESFATGDLTELCELIEDLLLGGPGGQTTTTTQQGGTTTTTQQGGTTTTTQQGGAVEVAAGWRPSRW
jgi:hypothetical protein